MAGIDARHAMRLLDAGVTPEQVAALLMPPAERPEWAGLRTRRERALAVYWFWAGARFGARTEAQWRQLVEGPEARP